MSGPSRGTARRSYRPAVEALEALRLLDATQSLPGMLVGAEVTPPIAPTAWSEATPVEADAAWDVALSQTRLDDLLRGARGETEARPEDVAAGLRQLDRYLARAWYRAGIPPQQHDDCTQAVYVSLLQNLGREGFDRLAAEVGQSGIREVLSRETLDGPDFFRAVDAVKKRAQRERSYQSLDQVDATLAAGDDGATTLTGSLREAMARWLNRREAELIDATLQGQTPAEIAQRWGVAPKTVSNEKTRAIQKLREALVAELDD